MLLTLRCYACDNTSCGICPIGSWNDEQSQKGCVRQVCEIDYIKFHHLFDEVYPFLKQSTEKRKKQVYQESVDLLNKIYNCAIVNKITDNGKLAS